MANGLTAQNLLAVPAAFIRTAEEFPAKVEQALALLDSVADVSELLAKADTYEHYARRIKVDTRTINCIQYGKLIIVAKLGQLLERCPPGRGKKNPLPGSGFLGLATETITTYRKVGDYAAQIPPYWEAAQADELAEMSISGFIRFVSSDGNLKAHQNKGVIEWYTPARYIEAARTAMGSIDLDPASNAKAQKIVKPGTYYMKADTCLALAKPASERRSIWPNCLKRLPVSAGGLLLVAKQHWDEGPSQLVVA